MRKTTNVNGRGYWPLPRLPLVAALVLPLAGCNLDSILEVTDPDVVTPEIVRDPNNLPGVRNGVIGDFAVGFSGQGNNTLNFVSAVGLFTDEFYLSDTFGTRREVDRRAIDVQNSEMTVVFRNLHRARRAAEVATELFAENSPNTAGHAEVANLAAYTYVFFAENYCSGVPFSRLRPDNTLEHGPQKTTQEIYSEALTRFDQTLQIANAAGTGSAAVQQQRLARIGRARVLLNLGRFSEAAAAVQGIPTSYVYLVEHSANTTRQNNGVWFLAQQRRGVGVAHREGGNGLPFRLGSSQDRSSQDPRVPYSRTNQRAIDFPFSHFFQQKYPTNASPTVLASGVEARLIEAEAALNRGQSAAYLTILNDLRANASTLLSGFGMTPAGVALTPLADPGTPQARVNQFFQERGFWLYMTGTRLADMRRLVRQYNRNAETVFPTGEYARPLGATIATADANLTSRVQGTYGSDVDLPIPFDEQNNPEFRECLSRGA